MGINISLWKIQDPNYEDEEIKDFDSARYVGDNDFATANLHWVTLDVDEIRYRRPFNIDFAIRWVKNNIESGNQDRLIKALEEMKMKKNLWFYFCW